jgi:hypothetical protein
MLAQVYAPSLNRNTLVLGLQGNHSEQREYNFYAIIAVAGGT